MFPYTLILVFLNLAASENCYWNRECPNQLHATKTTYETVRGDIRDYPDPESCEAVNVWTLHRHGNRNPGSVSVVMKQLIDIVQPQIIEAYEAGRSKLCAQDIEAFRKWTFNDTILVSQNYLTGTGYEELYDVAKRLRHRYPHLMQGGPDDYYFRPTNSQRTVASAMGFVHGFTDETGLNVTFDGPFERDDMIRPYENCPRYEQDVKGGALLEEQLADYAETDEYLAMLRDVQDRLGITYQLTQDNVYTLYEICRYHRSWLPTNQDAWCAAFSNEDLVILEYRDDVRHYYRNGYGSWVSNWTLSHSPPNPRLVANVRNYFNAEDTRAREGVDIQPSSGWIEKRVLSSFYKTNSRGSKVIRIEIYDASQFASTEQSICKCNAEICSQHVVENMFIDNIYIQVSPRLAGPLLKDLRERFQASIRGEGKKVVSYFSHNAMTEMTFAALGLRRDNFAIVGSKRVPERLWRTSFLAAFATNMMVVLNRCTESGAQTHRVQFFVNEKGTTLCPLSGCSWDQFEDMMKGFDDNLDFCSLDYQEPEFELPGGSNAVAVTGGWLVSLQVVFTYILKW